MILVILQKNHSHTSSGIVNQIHDLLAQIITSGNFVGTGITYSTVYVLPIFSKKRQLLGILGGYTPMAF